MLDNTNLDARATGNQATGSRYARNAKQPTGSIKVKDEEQVIDLCSSDSDTQDITPPGPPAPAPGRTQRQSRAEPPTRPKREPSDQFESDGDDDGDDSDFDASSDRKKKVQSTGPSKKRVAASATSKLYAVAQIATLATDAVESVSEAETKLANVESGILSRIQKSLALAKHPGTGEAEARQALRLATRLMASQNLTQADLLAASDSAENQSRAGMSIVEIVSQTNASPRNESWVNQVAVAINMFFDVKAYSTSYANRTKLSWTFYGLALNTVAAAYAFEMVHNQILTWANDKADAKQVRGKTGKNSYCQGVAAGLISLARKEKKDELDRAIQTENKRIRDAESCEAKQRQKEVQRLESNSHAPTVKPEPEPKQDPWVSGSGSRNVHLEDVPDEDADVKPFKRSASQEREGERYGGSELPFGLRSEYGYNDNHDHDHDQQYDDGDDDERDNEQWYDTHSDPPVPDGGDAMEVKPDFDEADEKPIIDLTLDNELERPDDAFSFSNTNDIKPSIKREASDHDIGHTVKGEPDSDRGTEAEWHSSGQLIRFRQDAEQIADEYLASQHSELKLRKRPRSTYKKDTSAFEQGRQDARKIDVKRKRIQN
ncbi:hypothetical protein BCV70DRAFT_162827 [Testicularia cyperi]|uniref:Uncharacterized protein n=1 Tax=Testicularia cyperi TaxID=1882483 RepID=A0A317XMK1_9BASI|nr:hypothetical protein BCV70DRAFT_162827 [Testicularia cyperi]